MHENLLYFCENFTSKQQKQLNWRSRSIDRKLPLTSHCDSSATPLQLTDHCRSSPRLHDSPLPAAALLCDSTIPPLPIVALLHDFVYPLLNKMHTPSGQPVRQQTHSNEDSDHDESADNTQREPAKRGYTKMRKITKMADGKQLDVNVNSYSQFNGQDATTFANYLGTLVRNGEEVPLNYMNWKDVPKDKNDRLWDLVKLKWNVQVEKKDQVMKSFGKKLREFRYSLKKKHYDTHDSYDARFADRDERVLPDHWKFLIDVWDSEDWQDKSKIGKASRAKQTTTHCAGSKSFARIAQEERVRLK